MKKRRRLCAPFLLIPFLIGLIPGFCTQFGWDIGSWYDNLPLVIYPAILALVVFSVLEYRDGNPLFRLFLPGLGAVGAGIALLWLGSLLGSGFIADYLQTVFALRGTPNLLIGWTGAILFTLCLFGSFVMLVRRTAETQTELQVLSLKSELAFENLRLVQQSAQELAAVRHDMLHHLIALAELDRAGERERVTEYLRRLTNEVGGIAPLRFTAQPTVNAILTAMLSRARGAGVQLTAHVELPEELPVPDTDLCGLLMNLLSNAVDAAAAAPEGIGHWVEFTMHIRRRYLFIEARNSCAGPVELDESTGLPHSRRGEGHGYGMKTMREIAHRYQSELQVETTGDSFLLRTALLMPGEGGARPKAS